MFSLYFKYIVVLIVFFAIFVIVFSSLILYGFTVFWEELKNKQLFSTWMGNRLSPAVGAVECRLGDQLTHIQPRAKIRALTFFISGGKTIE